MIWTKKQKIGAGMRSPKGGVLAFLLLTACAGMTAIGEGCDAYAEARLYMPPIEDGAADPLSLWVADLDDRMTGVCRRRR